MSQNIELTRRAVAEFNARDIEAFIALCDTQIELHSVFEAVGGAVYHGHDGVRKYIRDMEEAWGDELRLEPEAFFDLGEHTLVFNVLRGRGRHSGAELTRPVTQVSTWRDGLLVYLKTYLQREDALKDLGVSEAALDPIDP